MIKEQSAVPDAKAGSSAAVDLDKEIKAANTAQSDGKAKKHGFNTDFLLARALQTTVQNTSNTSV